MTTPTPLSCIALLVALMTLSVGCEGTLSDDEQLAARLAQEPSQQTEELVVGSTAMLTARQNAQAIRLADGRIFVVGGQGSTGNGVQTTELYNPNRGTWVAGPSLPATPSNHLSAVLLSNGQVLVLDSFLSTRLNPNAAAPIAVTAPPQSLNDVTAVALGTGAFVLARGTSGSAVAYQFTPGSSQADGGVTPDVWLPRSAPSLDPWSLSAVVLGNGAVFAVSGTTAALFDPVTDTWAPVAAPQYQLDRARLFVLANGNVAALNSQSCNGTPNCDRAIQVYAPATGTWSSVSTLNGHMAGAGALLEDGYTVLVAGGLEGFSSTVDTVETVNLATMQLVYQWTVQRLASRRTAVAATRLSDGRVVIAGGADSYASSFALGDTEVVSVQEPRVYTANGYAYCAEPGSLCNSYNPGRGSLRPELNAPNALAAPGTSPGAPGVVCADANSGRYLSDESIESVRLTTLDGGPFRRGAPVRVLVDVWAWAGYTSDKLDLFVAADANAPSWVLATTLTPTRAGLNTLSATITLPSGFSAFAAVRAQFRYNGTATPCASGPYNDRDDVVITPY